MTPELIAAIAGGIVTIIGAVGALYVSIKNGGKLNVIHVNTNSRLTAVHERVEQLTTAMNEHGMTVPQDPDVHPPYQGEERRTDG